MANDEAIHRLTIRVFRHWNGEIDWGDLKGHLDEFAGVDAYLMSPSWRIVRAHELMRPGIISVPVICPQTAAASLKLTDCEDHRPERVLGERVLSPSEADTIRMRMTEIRPHSRGWFPWERPPYRS